jgi:hypothetical protein
MDLNLDIPLLVDTQLLKVLKVMVLRHTPLKVDTQLLVAILPLVVILLKITTLLLMAQAILLKVHPMDLNLGTHPKVDIPLLRKNK